LFYTPINKRVMSTYVTQEGLDKLTKELKHLKRVERPSVTQQIAEARDKGDLSENAEYDAAKEAQGLLELKISKMEATLSDAVVIDESKLDTDRVLILSKVKLKNQNNGMEVEYTIVPETEADLKAKKISVESPIGKGLLGKKLGEIAEIQVPNGSVMFEIISIGR
jgi:transcription elongation factor GreA